MKGTATGTSRETSGVMSGCRKRLQEQFLAPYKMLRFKSGLFFFKTEEILRSIFGTFSFRQFRIISFIGRWLHYFQLGVLNLGNEKGKCFGFSAVSGASVLSITDSEYSDECCVSRNTIGSVTVNDEAVSTSSNLRVQCKSDVWSNLLALMQV